MNKNKILILVGSSIFLLTSCTTGSIIGYSILGGVIGSGISIGVSYLVIKMIWINSL